MSKLLATIFAITIAVAIVQFLGGWVNLGRHWLNHTAFMAVAFPALGAAIAGRRAQTEYERNAERSERLITQLHEFISRIDAAPDINHLWKVSTHVSQRLLAENRDWYDLMIFRDLELDM
jgi:hypothetical protein